MEDFERIERTLSSTEYRSAHMEFLLYGISSVAVSALLAATTVILWGVIAQSSVELGSVFVTASFVLVILSLWALHSHQSRQIYMYKLDRIHELESALAYFQHRRFVPDSVTGRTAYPIFGLSGHRIQLAIYAVSAMGAPAIGIARGAHAAALLPFLATVCLVTGWITHNERALKRQLR